MSYLILFDNFEIDVERCYFLTGCWDMKDAVRIFYSNHPDKKIDLEFFEKIIAIMKPEDVIELHNRLCPDFKIIEIYKNVELAWESVPEVAKEEKYDES